MDFLTIECWDTTGGVESVPPFLGTLLAFIVLGLLGLKARLIIFSELESSELILGRLKSLGEKDETILCQVDTERRIFEVYRI